KKIAIKCYNDVMTIQPAEATIGTGTGAKFTNFKIESTDNKLNTDSSDKKLDDDKLIKEITQSSHLPKALSKLDMLTGRILLNFYWSAELPLRLKTKCGTYGDV